MHWWTDRRNTIGKEDANRRVALVKRRAKPSSLRATTLSCAVKSAVPYTGRICFSITTQRRVSLFYVALPITINITTKKSSSITISK